MSSGLAISTLHSTGSSSGSDSDSGGLRHDGRIGSGIFRGVTRVSADLFGFAFPFLVEATVARIFTFPFGAR